MSWFEHLLSSELIYRMGYALLGSLWQGVLVAMLLAGALAVIPRTKSSLRYWCGCIALFALPVLFCATAVLVGERENVIGPIVPETTTVAMDDTVTEKIDSSTSAGGTGQIDEPVVSTAADIEPAEVPASSTSWYRRLSDTVEPWAGHVVLCWFVGVFAMSVWNLGGWIAVRRLRCIGISPVSERFVAMLSELAGRLGVKHPVRLLQSAVVQSPMTIGWLKPVILVPASILCELSPKQIETILAHELAHIRRFDYLVNLLQTVVETLLFHHPAVWWISHKIRSERECCCDDAVVKLTSDELNYAKALTAIADLRRDVPQLAVAAAGGSLLSRIQRILGLSNKKTLSGSTWLASLLALVICIAAAVSIVNAAAAPPRDPASQKLIIGTWKSTALPDRTTETVDSIRMTFEADGSGSGTTVFQDGRTTPVKFSYRFERRRLLIGVDEPGDEPEAYRWNIRKNKLRLRDNKGDMEFERVENPDETVQSQIVGTWEHVNSVGDNADQIKEGVWTFNGDGTFIIEGKDKDDKQHVSAGKYHFEEDTLYFTMGDEKAQTVAMLEGENLTIVFAGTKYTLRKKTATVDSADRSAFLGTWDMIEGTGSYARGFKSVTVVFDADGGWTVEYVDSKGQKDADEGKLTFKAGRVSFDDDDDVVIELDAGRMTISENDTTFTFKRRDDAEAASEDTAAATAAEPLLGTWEMIEVTGENADDAGMGTWTFNPDGTLVIESTDAQGKSRIQTSPYTFKNGRISIDAGEDVVITIAGDLLTAIGANTKAVFKKQLPTKETPKTPSKVGTGEMVEAGGKHTGKADITPYVGSWLIPDRGVMMIDRSGVVTMHPFEGDPEQAMIVRSDNGEYILNQGETKHSMAVTGDVLSFTQIDNKAHPDKPHQYSLKRIRVDERFVGSWKSKEFTGSIDKQITALFLTLKDDSTFTLLGEGADAGKPIKGFYQTDGDILTLRARSSDKVAMDFIKSARYDSGTIRLAIGGGAAVLSKVIPNPFDGGEHPMFRTELISSTNGLGNKLDLDTGESVSAEKWEQMAEKDRAMFELTISLGKVKLTSSNRKAKMLPVRDAGMSFAKAGATAVKYLSSLEKSRLRGSDYKGGIFLAVLTDRGNLAVVQMMTPTGEDQTPVGWSLAQIHKDAGEAPTVELTQTDLVEKETVEIKSRRVTIPDADTKNVPTILDLAGGEMLPFPDDIEGVDLLGHFTKLGKGDLLFDRLFAVLRGGSAQIWNDGQWTLLTPEDRQADATAYKLPESLPCRLLVTTGDGKQFDVNALARTTDGGIEIEYKPLDPADSTRDESVQIQASRATLPDFNKQQILLDLAGGNTILVPGILNDDEATRTLFRELKKGDLAFDDALVVLRGGTAYLWDGKAATALMAPPQDKFNLKGYELPSIPCRFLVTTGDGKQFDVTVLAHTEDGGIEIEYKPIGVEVTLPGVARKSAREKDPGQPQQPLPAISIAPSIETVGDLKDLRIIAQAVNAYGAEKIVKAGMWEIRTADNSKRVAQIPFDWPWPRSPEKTPLGPDGKPPWPGWGDRSGVFNLTASQLRLTGRLEDGVYLLAWIINGTRQSNVCHFRINRRHQPANEPLLRLSALPPAPRTTRNGKLVPPRRLLSLRYTRRSDSDPVINNDQVAFATLNVDGKDRRPKMMVWTGPVGPPKVGGNMTYLLDMDSYEPAIEPDKPHLVIAKIGNRQSNDIDLTPAAAMSPAWDVAAARLGPPQAARIAIQGRVIGSNGKGAANYVVCVEHEQWKNNTGDLPVEMTDKDGYFTFYNLPAGLYDVFANPVGKGQPMLRITGVQLTEKKPVELELDFEHKFTFSGRVTDAADQPVSGRDVMGTWKSPDGKAEFNDFSTTDAAGRYTLGSPFPVAAYVGLSGTGPQPKPHRNVQQDRKDVDFQTPRANNSTADSIGDIDPTDPQAISALIEDMTDEDGKNGGAAAELLAKVGPVNREVVMAFIGAADNNRRRVSYACDTFFTYLGPEHSYVVGDLIEMLKTDNERVQRLAITALGNMGQAAVPAVPYLSKCMSNPQLESPAAGALRRLGPKAVAAVPHLSEMLQDKHKKSSAALVLEAIGPAARQAIPALQNCLGQVPMVTFARALLAIDPKSARAADDLVRIAESPYVPNQWTEQPDAHYLLVKYGYDKDKHLQALIDALSNPNSRIRLSAAAYLGRLAPDAHKAVDSLQAALKDTDGEVRIEAARAILKFAPGRLLRKQAADVVLSLLDSEEIMVQIRAAETLQAFGPEEAWAAATLIEKTHARRQRTRLAAIQALGNIGRSAKEALPGLRQLLKNDHWPVRNAAARAIRQIEETAEDAKVGLLNHSTADTTEYVVKPGDTLAGISEEVLGTAQRYPQIMKLNGLEKVDSLRAGMVLKLP